MKTPQNGRRHGVALAIGTLTIGVLVGPTAVSPQLRRPSHPRRRRAPGPTSGRVSNGLASAFRICCLAISNLIRNALSGSPTGRVGSTDALVFHGFVWQTRS